jgi:hypothetical protein
MTLVSATSAIFSEIKDRDCPDEEMLSVTITRHGAQAPTPYVFTQVSQITK